MTGVCYFGRGKLKKWEGGKMNAAKFCFHFGRTQDLLQTSRGWGGGWKEIKIKETVDKQDKILFFFV